MRKYCKGNNYQRYRRKNSNINSLGNLQGDIKNAKSAFRMPWKYLPFADGRVFVEG